MNISVETVVKAKLNKVWDAWNNPAEIKQWNTAQDDWHTTRLTDIDGSRPDVWRYHEALEHGNRDARPSDYR